MSNGTQRCWNCRSETAAQAKFCANCGVPLSGPSRIAVDAVLANHDGRDEEAIAHLDRAIGLAVACGNVVVERYARELGLQIRDVRRTGLRCGHCFCVWLIRSPMIFAPPSSPVPAWHLTKPDLGRDAEHLAHHRPTRRRKNDAGP
jgi:hypothetical protein